MKKTIALILSAIMLVSVMSTGIFAAPGDYADYWEGLNEQIGNDYRTGGTHGIYHIILNVNAVRTLTVNFKCQTATTSPVKALEIKIPAAFKGTIGVMPVNDAYLAGLNSVQFVAKYNTIYTAPKGSEFDSIIYVQVPSGYVVIPELVELDLATNVFSQIETETLTIATGDASWILNYDLITKEAYAAVLAELQAYADAIMAALEEEVVEEVAAVEEETDEEIAEDAEAVEEEEAAASEIDVDIDAVIASVQESIGGVEVFDLSEVIVDLDEDGVISIEELMAAFLGLEENEAIGEEIFGLIDGALTEILGEYYDILVEFIAALMAE